MSDGRIDVHSHFLPDFYREAATAAGHAQPDGIAELPVWTAAGHVAMMDHLGIATSLLSISSPGVHFGDDGTARDLARQVNEEGSSCYGSASRPVRPVRGAADAGRGRFDRRDPLLLRPSRRGRVALLTNADGTYLGDPVLEPVFDELDRRHARVFVHPTSPACWESTSLGRPRPRNADHV
jgi:hypothetical protein